MKTNNLYIFREVIIALKRYCFATFQMQNIAIYKYINKSLFMLLQYIAEKKENFTHHNMYWQIIILKTAFKKEFNNYVA